MSAFDRRSVLLGGATLLGGALAGCPPDKPHPSGVLADPDAGAKPGPPEGEMTVGEVLPILVAVSDRLLPSDDLGPGVKEAGIDRYLESVLQDARMRGVKSLVTRAAVFVGRAARKEHGKPFWELADKDKDDLIQRLADNKVRPNGFSPQAFIRIMLALCLECFLGDPKHGGNKDEIGWKFVGGVHWAGRQP